MFFLHLGVFYRSGFGSLIQGAELLRDSQFAAASSKERQKVWEGATGAVAPGRDLSESLFLWF